MSRMALRGFYRLTLHPARIAYFTTKSPLWNKDPYDQLVQHAIKSQSEQFTHRGSGEIAALDESTDHPTSTHPFTQSPAKPGAAARGVAPEQDIQRQWAWSVAEEMMVDAKEERTSQILDEVGRMEVFLDNVADRVKVVKTQLDHLEEEGGPVLNLKDSS